MTGVAPPSYESATENGSNKSLWRSWFDKFLNLQFNNDEATEYARLFVNNEIDLSMVNELNDGVLKSIGIEKAGHRIRILRLQDSQETTGRTRIVAPAFHCVFHPNLPACGKCYRCQRFLCLKCRRQKNCDHGTKYYCANCYEECVIL